MRRKNHPPLPRLYAWYDLILKKPSTMPHGIYSTILRQPGEKGAALKQSGETYRDNIYFIILARVRKKYPKYTEKQLHAVTAALRAKAMETEKLRA